MTQNNILYCCLYVKIQRVIAIRISAKNIALLTRIDICIHVYKHVCICTFMSLFDQIYRFFVFSF